MSETFLNTVDTTRVDELMNEMETAVQYFNNIALNTANKYTADLDGLMDDLYKVVTQPNDVETITLERYYLELTNLLYFMVNKVEQLNVYADLAKAQAKEVYNKNYLFNSSKEVLDKSKKMTVAELTATAEETAKYESTLETVYKSAYSIAKSKVNAGFEMVNTMRKILSIRQTEMQLDLTPGMHRELPEGGDNF